MIEFIYGVRDKDGIVTKRQLRDNSDRKIFTKAFEKQGFRIVNRKQYRAFMSHKAKMIKRRKAIAK